ncbi:hypothetical protein [Myroides odoratimimus]|uniref:hypothetical protein n=1 Tax=Myroides odoratimimus TaxID=76832 RepID=UPI002574F58E|nr:hypothetical protein [Myroides odoratimimus]MDM1454775.1 phenylacetate--CoA ligase family protein [Myroides odoratimimus]MDM1478502.1 phenylacetate--CoA ligase family protein [Myroides odoratimimus]MDM1490832.1 phenylacetate--CoA ligase family protein [Myroides odoratimimus]
MKNVRYYIFWILDYLKGQSIRKEYKEIEKCFYDKEFKNLTQNKNLKSILDYSVNFTAYYKKFDSNNILSFPIINKKNILDNYDLFFSSDYNLNDSSLRVMSTSGSSGVPFRIYQNQEKIKRNSADLLFFYNLGNYNIGDRVFFMRIWNSVNVKSKFTLFKENFRMYDTSNIDLEGANRFTATMLNDRSKKVVLAYASSFTALMEHLGNESNVKLDWNIKSIITGAEELPVSVKHKMIKTFDCPVLSRYSNQENGILAQQPVTGEDYFELNEGSYYFEFLKLNSDEPAKEGELSRIVITDLFNKVMPIIRYDTGDLCEFGYENNKKVIKSIKGRSIDLLRNSKNEVLSPHVVTNLMWKYPDVKEFQLIQKDLINIDLFLVHAFSNKENSINSLITELIGIFGVSSVIKIIEVESIPLEKSGKRKYIKSLIQ